MQTVISVLEDRPAAQRAVERLVGEGFHPNDVHLQEGAALANTSAAIPGASASAQTGPERGVLSSIGRVFASMFGEDPPAGYVDRYSEAVWRGHPVVVVDARDPQEAERASGILREFGAIDIDERGARWHRPGVQAGTGSSTDVVTGIDAQMQAARAGRFGVRAIDEREGAMAANPPEWGSDSN